MRDILWISIFLACTHAASNAFAACEPRPSNHAKGDQVAAYAERAFREQQYDCGTNAINTWELDQAPIDAPEVENGQFSLRNFGLTVSKHEQVPPALRMDLLRAITRTSWTETKGGSQERRKYDTLLLIKAGANFKQQRDLGAQLDATLLALKIDKRQPKEDQFVSSYELYSLASTGGIQENLYDKYVSIAQITLGNESAIGLRSQMAWDIYYQLATPKPSFTRSDPESPCVSILHLRDALADVKPGYNLPVKWQWKPTMAAAACFYKIDRLEKASELIREAENTVRSIDQVEQKLGQYRFLVSDLIEIKYDKPAVQSLLNEMLLLAGSSDSEMARETLSSVPLIIKNRLTY
jgi:hypothetical protein